MAHTNYSTDGDKFQNYYKDVSLRMKNKELDLLIVVSSFFLWMMTIPNCRFNAA